MFCMLIANKDTATYTSFLVLGWPTPVVGPFHKECSNERFP